MSGVNKVILVGRLGADPELRSTQSGTQMCNLSLATSDTWVKDGKREERTEWHRIVLWDKLADLAQKYLRKGRMVYVEGKLQTRSWVDAQGQKHYMTEIVGQSMQFIDGSAGNAGVRGPQDRPGSEEGSGFGGQYSENNGGAGSQGSDPFYSNAQQNGEDIPF